MIGSDLGNGPRVAAPRWEGYAPLREYAALGDGRTVALLARDGSVDWLTMPDLDSPTVFGAVLDARRGGCFALQPELPYQVSRRYLPSTNVVETTFTTAAGAVRVTDALTLPGGALTPTRELVRKVEGLSGAVPMRWSVQPRFGYGAASPCISRRAGLPVASAGTDALAVCTWGAGEPLCAGDEIEGAFEIRLGSRADLALSFAHEEPLVVPARAECAARLEETGHRWRAWLRDRACAGRWQKAVTRSALALKLLVYAPSGAVAAAATSSLPEEIGGERNWDYRFSWLRDSVFTLDALLTLGCPSEAQAYFWWLMHATQFNEPRLRPLYRLDGGVGASERVLALEGYRGSAPVRVGNAAAEQLQLDTYGELLQTAWLYATASGQLDPDIARRLARVADFVCASWRQPDEGIWEVRSPPQHFTQSKMMCWIALDRALRLAERGLLSRRHAPAWRREQAVIEDFIETRCLSENLNSYVRSADAEEVDVSVLLGLLRGYASPQHPRMHGTIEAIRRDLAHGPFVYRYGGDDGLQGTEGAFVACSFWLAEALARCGHLGEAAELMDQLVGLANDVGLYSEEIDPNTGEFLGNMPQGLTHLALISAACAITEQGMTR
ncbi:glycoside hydrolase family 15 protein [Saccharopolyspora sp. ASAGF58]|uniref:glycoside hydrolase family 15 protein n=1 Tax=Saccharopolyspora sp. ASAGF58 TaxID=2719023 RepID=UPI001440262E|nr:glycoside hydrolase family 15 protein [Saccharopolyspora sp. ASAGF58]QIZ38374.1 glycoside hydrolase family 15 protein [Saccharopolyspora sp. ASAGF58]